MRSLAWTNGASSRPSRCQIICISSPRPSEASVSAYSKWFKRWFNQAYCRQNCGPSVPDDSTPSEMTWRWQEGCFDRLLRSDESLSEKWEYLRQNPVRAGLVHKPGDWPYQYAFNFEDAKL